MCHVTQVKHDVCFSLDPLKDIIIIMVDTLVMLYSIRFLPTAVKNHEVVQTTDFTPNSNDDM